MSELRERVRRRYAAAAESSTSGGCCADDCCTDVATADDGPFGSSLYAAEDLAVIPRAAATASLGCGDPVTVSALQPGETVLDLGSGAGIDVLLSAKRVGPDGFVYGLDMTDEMLEAARRNQAEAGVTNVEFLKGLIEDIPLDAGTVDVILSNCVINLSTDKRSVLTEMHRVLRPGGRIAVSDVVADNHLTEEDRQERGSWVGCIAGALSFDEYRTGLRDAGFGDVTIDVVNEVADGMHSAVVRATKPS